MSSNIQTVKAVCSRFVTFASPDWIRVTSVDSSCPTLTPPLNWASSRSSSSPRLHVTASFSDPSHRHNSMKKYIALLIVAITLIAGTTINVNAKPQRHHREAPRHIDNDERGNGNRHNVPDSGSTLPLLGAGIFGLFLIHRVAQKPDPR